MNMRYRPLSPVAYCIGCGCHDLRACEGGCSWLRVDYKAHAGVCSQCGPHIVRWDAGDRQSTAPMLSAPRPGLQPNQTAEPAQ